MTLFDKVKNDPNLISSIEKCEEQASPILKRYITNFPDYTDHTIDHSKSVLKNVEYILSDTIQSLNSDEAYILIMSCYLHDIGMCPNKTTVSSLKNSAEYLNFTESSNRGFEDFLRTIHHELSYTFILDNWKSLGIINLHYAKAIAIVSIGHREKELLDFDFFTTDFTVKSGRDFICLPFLAAVLRIADELDITNDRTPDLLFDKYLPENKISKKEWEKHKSTYKVNYKNNVIILTANCSDPHIYTALKKQYRKLSEVLNYVQKVIRALPREDNQRNLCLEFTRVEEKIETEGFLPKNIGFSFDLQRTLETFVGENLYRSKNVAIREVLQNSIDSCHYKNFLTSSYKPTITLNLFEDKLIIQDDGLGMDEFIIRNYFAKMASSYYKQSNIKQSFESIGEFGIGVLSYFLLCDFFDVETKMESKEALSFRVTKNANTDFYFLSNTDKIGIGTKITFYLKENLTFDNLVNIVKYYFRHIDIDINLIYKSRKEVVRSRPFKNDPKSGLTNIVSEIFYNKIPELTTIDKHIATDDFEGSISLTIGKDSNFAFRPYSDINSIFKSEYRNINVSQKGVFVNHATDSILNGLYGDINFKKKNQLNLSRNFVTNQKGIVDIVNLFEYEILNELFSAWNGLTLKQSSLLSKLWAKHTLKTSHSLNNQLAKLLINNLVVDYFDKNKLSMSNLSHFSKFKEFFLMPYYEKDDVYNQIYDLSVPNELYTNFKNPVLFVLNDINKQLLFRLFIQKGYSLSLVSFKSEKYYKFSNEGEQNYYESFAGSYEKIVPFSNKELCAFPTRYSSKVFNFNHPIIRWIHKNEKYVKENQPINDLVKMFLRVTSNFVSDVELRNPFEKTKFSLTTINSVLTHLNKLSGTNFVLTKRDFDEKYFEVIKK